MAAKAKNSRALWELQKSLDVALESDGFTTAQVAEAVDKLM